MLALGLSKRIQNLLLISNKFWKKKANQL